MAEIQVTGSGVLLAGGLVPKSQLADRIPAGFEDLGAAGMRISGYTAFDTIEGIRHAASVIGIDTSVFGQVHTFTASGAFTVPAGVTKVLVVAVGGAGGGGVARTQGDGGTSDSGGTTYYPGTTSVGGCGGQAMAEITVVAGQTITATVGGGGAARSNNSGLGGGASSVAYDGTTYASANGGGGGAVGSGTQGVDGGNGGVTVGTSIGAAVAPFHSYEVWNETSNIFSGSAISTIFAQTVRDGGTGLAARAYDPASNRFAGASYPGRFTSGDGAFGQPANARGGTNGACYVFY